MKIRPVEAEYFMRMNGWTDGGAQTAESQTETDKQSGRDTVRQTVGNKERQSDRCTVRQTSSRAETVRQTIGHKDRQSDRHSERQT